MPSSLLWLSTPSDLNLLPKFGHPFPPEVDIELFFFFFRFFFFFHFLLNFFWCGFFFFLFFLVASALVFLFLLLFLVACALFFLEGRSGAPEPNFVPVLAWGPKGGCPNQ